MTKTIDKCQRVELKYIERSFDYPPENLHLSPSEQGFIENGRQEFPIKIEKFQMSKQKHLKKKKLMLEVIARLFASQGYHYTSMREIARALEMNQSSLYYYFKSKEDILFELMDDAVDEAMSTMEKISNEDLPAEEKLKKVLGFYISYYAGDQDRLNLLVNEMNSLKKEHRQQLVEKQRRYVLLLKSILETLGEQKVLKEIPSSVAAFAFFGMVHYTIKWYHKEGKVKLDDLSRIFVEIFTDGLLKSPTSLERHKEPLNSKKS
ncbi:TetR/AcrR family transcriptional regulator [Thermodesulfobacteriota bacterium]